MKRAYADLPEGQVHYRTEGSGEAVVCIHGISSTSEEFEEMIPILAKSYRVIAIDIMGFGMSDNPPRLYEIADYARSVISLLDALGIKRTSFVTHHTGSTIAIDVAVSYPERVNKLVLAGVATMDVKEWEEYRLRAFGDGLGYHPKKITEDGSFLADRYKDMKKRFPHFPTPEADLKHFLRMQQSHAGPGNAYYAGQRYDIKSRLPLITQPVLLVMGEDDAIAYTFEATKKLLPRAKAIVIKGGGNALAAEKPREFAQAALDFLKDPRR